MDIGLVLGGGGARGYAHIGVLRALLEHNCQPVAISGCSMGGLVGAFFAAGYSPDAMEALIREAKLIKFLEVGSLGGIIGGGGLEKFLHEHLPENFEELSLPLAVTTVDVQKGELVILRSGKLIPALRATSALPGIFSPMKHRERYLIDGGLLNNLPVDVIRTMTLEPIIAVDVAAPPDRTLEFGDEAKASGWSAKLQQVFSGGMQGFAERVKNVFSGITLDFLSRSLTIELFMKSFDVPQAVLTELRLAMQPPALLIRPELDHQFGVEDFERLDEALKAGYQAACKCLPEFFAKQQPALPSSSSQDNSDSG